MLRKQSNFNNIKLLINYPDGVLGFWLEKELGAGA